MVTAPRTRYAQSGGVDIAYQVLGDGPLDLLIITGSSIPIDCVDLEPSMARFQRRLSSYCRVIRFDLRGLGLSGHLPPGAGMGVQEWAADAVAVLDAVGSSRAAIFGPTFGAPVAVELAATHPERVSAVVIVNGAVRSRWAEDYPDGVDTGTVSTILELGPKDDALELGFDGLSLIAPSVGHDPEFRRWWDHSGNRAATPSVARMTSAVLAETDVRHRLDELVAPLLVLHRSEARFITIGHGRYIGDRVPQARFVELPGNDTLYWVGDTEQMHGEIEEFLTGSRGASAAERVLSTVLFTDIVASTDHAATLGDLRWRDLLDNHDALVRAELGRFQGREVNTAGDGFVATFVSPSRAIACAEAIVARVRPLGIEVRAGIHAGELEVRGHDIAGMAVHIGARVAATAGAGEVLVSSTVRDIVTGSGRTFTDRGEHELKGVPGRWRLCAVDPES